MKHLTFLAVICGLFAFAFSSKIRADTLNDIKQRGVIYIGVKSDLKPWGFKPEKGEFEGMEIDLAQDIAKRLKVRAELVPTTTSERIQFLNEGKVDLILATLSVTEERKKQVHFVEPNYYAAMTGVLSRTGSGIGNEASLRGRKICAIAGAYYNPVIANMTGRDLIESKSLIEAEENLRAQSCEGLAFDDVALLYRVKSEQEKWKDYDVSLLLTVTPAAWGIAVHKDEKDTKFDRFLKNTVIDWHTQALLLTLEKKWVGDNSMALKWLSDKVKQSGQLNKVSEPRPTRERDIRARPPSERRQASDFNPFLN